MTDNDMTAVDLIIAQGRVSALFVHTLSSLVEKGKRLSVVAVAM